MKISSFLLVLGFCVLGFASRAAAQNLTYPVLVVVNDSDPSAVTFTATTADPIFASSNHPFSEGFDLIQFFTSSIGTNGGTIPFSVTGSGLTTYLDGTPHYNTAQADYLGEYEGDINLYTSGTGSASDQTFATASQAFTGTETLDLSSYSSYLPASGTLSYIYVGHTQTTNPVQLIGAYQVVPEPSQWSLLLLGAAGLFALRRFRPSSAKS